MAHILYVVDIRFRFVPAGMAVGMVWSYFVQSRLLFEMKKKEQATFLTPPPIVAPYAYGQDTSYLGPGYNFEASIQQILDLGGGCWNREIVIRALRATYNNKERAIEFLYSGISEQALILPVFDRLAGDQGFPDMRSNAGVGPLDFLRNSPQFRAMRAVVQANPQTLQPMLRELGMQNPHLMQRIQQHYADFLRLEERNVTVTLEEREVIERLEAMGFDRAIVLEVFFACNKNEELAANYLLDHMHEFEN